MKFFAKRLPALLLLAALTVSAAQPAAALQLPSLQWPSFGKEEEVAVESIDPGSYNAEMTLGTTQQLKPTVLPDNATDKEVVFASEDISIIQVGQDGLIGAASVGTTRVSATAGGVTIYYTITVTPDPSTVVSDMDAAISEEEIAVGATATISVSVSPSSAASTANVTFSSSNESVATVNNFGRVTGVGKGSATITITCGDIVRTVSVKVYVPTDGIHLNTNYLVLKPGATAQISGSVSPSTAPQGLTFRSRTRDLVYRQQQRHGDRRGCGLHLHHRLQRGFLQHGDGDREPGHQPQHFGQRFQLGLRGWLRQRNRRSGPHCPADQRPPD